MMETTTMKMSGEDLLDRLAARGMRTSVLADEAGIDRAAMSAILHGRQYCGRVRKAKIERAIVTLGLDREASDRYEELVFTVERA